MSILQQRMAGPAAAPARRFRTFFVYGITFTGLAPGATAPGVIQIAADSDFETQKLTMFADVAGAVQREDTRELPLVTVQLTDTGSGRQLFNEPVAIPALFGDGRIPFILPVTYLFAANASVAVSVSNFSAATTYRLRLYAVGAKIFAFS